MQLDKQMIEQIENISKMNYGETYDEWHGLRMKDFLDSVN